MAAFVTANGRVTATAHLSPRWVGCNVQDLLQSHLPANYYFALDTPAPALGEAYYGAGRGLNDFAYVTVSTGIGAGIISQGRVFTGGLGWAGDRERRTDRGRRHDGAGTQRVSGSVIHSCSFVVEGGARHTSNGARR